MFSVDDSFQKHCMSFVSIHVTVTSVDVLSTKKGFECLYKQWINKGGFESEFKLFNSIQKSLLKDNRNLPKNQVILHSDSNIGLYPVGR